MRYCNVWGEAIDSPRLIQSGLKNEFFSFSSVHKILFPRAGHMFWDFVQNLWLGVASDELKKKTDYTYKIQPYENDEIPKICIQRQF